MSPIFRKTYCIIWLFTGSTVSQELHEQIIKYYSSGHYDSVCTVYENNFSAVESLPARQALLTAIAKSYYFTDRLDQSLQLYQQLSETPVNDSVLFFRVLIDYSLVLIETGQYIKALSILDRCRGLMNRFGDQQDRARFFSRFAVYYLRTSDYRLSLSYLDTAAAIAEKTDNPSLMSNLLTCYGIAYRELGYYTKALEVYKRATVIDSVQGNINDLAVDYMNTGNVYNELGLFRKSILLYTKALKCYEDLRDTSGLSMVYGNLGVAYYELADYEQSVESLMKSERLNKGLDSLGTANAKLNLAIAFLSQSMYDTASTLLIDAGLMFHRLSRFSEEAFCLTYRGRALMKISSMFEAESCFLEALRLFKDYASGNEDWFVYSEYARFKYITGKQDSAFTMLKSALQKIELQRSFNDDAVFLTHFLENEIQSVYRFYVYLNIMKGRTRKALEAFEKIKARTLKDEFRQNSFSDSRFQYIQYFNHDSLWYAFLINGNNISVEFLNGSNALSMLVREHYSFLQSPNSDINRLNLLSGKLYGLLIKPMEEKIGDSIPLIIVPDGILHYLPFETMWTGRQYLVERFRIAYSASSVLGNDERTVRQHYQHKHHSVVVFKSDYADMEYEDADVSFDTLHFVDSEKKGIMNYFISDSVILIDQDVVETKLKEVLSDTIDILHIAAHGLANPDFPGLSSIVAGVKAHSGDDGYLTADEIENLEIRARLVVLSACQTSLGELLRSEGMIGLTRAFLRSGSSAVISTLWKIRDSSTSVFMDRFYYYLKRENLNPADALQKAKIDLLRSQYRHPFYWGAFILWGN